MASTYPLEVVQAERWLNANKNLQGEQLKEAVDKQPWDDSVKSLIATPSVLETMNSKIDWTQKLGSAVIEQQHSDLVKAVLGGNEQRRPPELAALVHVGAGIHQYLHRLKAALTGGELQRRESTPLLGCRLGRRGRWKQR